MIRPLLGALALLAFAAPAASASDAEIFATNNTAVITDPGDPRLKDNLKDFARQVERIIDDGGGEPRGSQLLDGVFSSDGDDDVRALARVRRRPRLRRTSCTRSPTRSARASSSSRC